jgi:acetate kinase
VTGTTRILVVNPGSSTLKVALVVDGKTRDDNTVTLHAGFVDTDEIEVVIERWTPIDAVGVRFVHGGPDHFVPVRIDDRILAELDEVAGMAPLHNPPALAAIRAVRAALPETPIVACFDTNFHRTIPDEAALFAIPREWTRRWKLRRYGFHGLNHEYAAGRAAALLDRPLKDLRIVTCHLGGGSSLCAVAGGESVDTTMGYTPLDGLVMQVRSGAVDPGLLLWLQQQGGLDVAELADGLEQHGGLAGLTGTTGDMREVVSGIEQGDADAQLAFDIYLHRLVREIGAMVTSAGGIDALVFTGGIGEHQSVIRARASERLAHLGLRLDAHLNSAPTGPDRVVSATDSAAAVLVVEAREDLQIAALVEGVTG